MNESHFAGVGAAVEHAFAEERGPERYAVESTDQLTVFPGFDAVGKSQVVQPNISADDFLADPAIASLLHAAAHDAFEGGIDANVIDERVLFQPMSLSARDVKL